MPRRKPAKRENGCGTVYKRSDLKHRPWVAAAPASLDGGRIARTVGGCYVFLLGVRPLPPHATRRTFSTRMSAAGVRQEDMIALMGHADFSVDIDHYIRQSAPTLAAAVEKIK